VPSGVEKSARRRSPIMTPGPQPDAVEDQDREAEPGGRPQGRHRAVEVGELEADAACEVVHHRDDERPDIATALPSADETYAHGLAAESNSNPA
jgi:hypothetical protein